MNLQYNSSLICRMLSPPSIIHANELTTHARHTMSSASTSTRLMLPGLSSCLASMPSLREPKQAFKFGPSSPCAGFNINPAATYLAPPFSFLLDQCLSNRYLIYSFTRLLLLCDSVSAHHGRPRRRPAHHCQQATRPRIQHNRK